MIDCHATHQYYLTFSEKEEPIIVLSINHMYVLQCLTGKIEEMVVWFHP